MTSPEHAFFSIHVAWDDDPNNVNSIILPSFGCSIENAFVSEIHSALGAGEGIVDGPFDNIVVTTLG